MQRFPRKPRFNDDTDFPEREPRSAIAEPRRALRPEPSEREPFRFPRVTVRKNNEATVLDRRFGYDLRTDRSQDRLESDRSGRRMSALPQQVREAALRQKVVAASLKSRSKTAQAIGADRRLFGSGFPKTVHGGFARIEAKPSGRFRFQMPSSVYPCVQRSVRREVLFSLNRVGKGKSLRGPRRRTLTSNIGCN